MTNQRNIGRMSQRQDTPISKENRGDLREQLRESGGEEEGQGKEREGMKEGGRNRDRDTERTALSGQFYKDRSQVKTE